ncbi:lipase 3-like [Nasonia vitripennis]|uniref:Lipase n=1 Tax=Nasonia vitripennis TaxID=7425 RepID=A0A7M7LVC2_NASVI|nr:lipase 3-like [Nasonia vitripennis]
MVRNIAIVFCVILCSTEIFATFELIRQFLENTDTNITRVRTQEERKARSEEFVVLDFIGLVEQYEGYTAEEYDVKTDDGYILKLHQITGSPSSPKAAGKPVVYFQHGLFGDSDFQVVLGSKQALTFLLADAGYDVWLGNCRGTTYSKRHVKYSARGNNLKFWKFSMDEMALIDLPKFIDVVLEKTGQKNIGYSMGTTLDFMLLSEKPEYNNKMNIAIHIAPVAYFTPPFKPLINTLLALAPAAEALSAAKQIYQVLPQSKLIQIVGTDICGSELGKIFCGTFLSAVVNVQYLNFTALPEILAYVPAGTSRNTVMHYYQMIKNARFAKFDFGLLANPTKYGSIRPPTYDLSKITFRQAIFYSNSDVYVSVTDATKIKNELKNVVAFEKAPRGYNHLDFMWAEDATYTIYPQVLKVIADNS